MSLDIELRKNGRAVYELDSVSTDDSGGFSVEAIMPGVYDVWVDSSHTLSNIKHNVLLQVGSNPVYMGELQEGDASGDNLVDVDDFGLLKEHFFTPFAAADFNQDGIVDVDDFGLLKLNFGEFGDVVVALMSSDAFR